MYVAYTTKTVINFYQAALFVIDQHFDSGMRRVPVFVSASCMHKNVHAYIMCVHCFTQLSRTIKVVVHFQDRLQKLSLLALDTPDQCCRESTVGFLLE